MLKLIKNHPPLIQSTVISNTATPITNPFNNFFISGQEETFVPTDISDCELWLPPLVANFWQEHDSKTTQSSGEGDSVGTWEDKSGEGNDFIGDGNSAHHPTVDLDAVNGYPAIYYDGTDDILRKTMTGRTEWTVGLLLKSNGTYSRPIRMGHYQCRLYVQDGSDWFWEKDEDNGSPNLGGDPTNWTAIIVRTNSTSSMDISINGGSLQNIDPDNDINSTGWQLSDNGGWGGWTAEVVKYSRAVTNDELDQISSHLMARGGLS